MKKTIAIVTPKIDTFSNPTLTILFEKLIEQNYKIIFFGFEQLFIPRHIRSHMEIHPLPFNYYSFYRRSYDVIKLIKQYYDLYKIFKIENKIKTIICVDPMGLVVAGRIKKLIDVKLIYASFEIFFEDEFYIQRKKVIKQLESKYSENVDLVVIQDRKREQLLRAVNNFNSGTKFLHIPVSPKRIKSEKYGNELQTMLGIPHDKTVVVFSGTLQKWSGIHEILDLFQSGWNNDFWLLIHSHYILADDDPLKQRINDLIKKKMNISFHNEPFYEFQGYANFLSSCGIGIATYYPNTIDIFAGKNILEIGLSSGKFSTYMMLGIPSITTSNSMFKELNERFNFGATIVEPSEIPEALSNIKKDYTNKVIGCKEIYDTILDPENKMEELMNVIENFSSNK